MENDEFLDQAPAAETPEERVIRLEGLNKRLYARAKKAEGFIQDPTTGEWVKKTVEPAKPDISEQRQHTDIKPSDVLRSDEFKLHRMGYDENAIDIIMHNGGMKLLDDKSNPIVLGLQASKEQRSAEAAAEMASGASGLSDIERKYTETDLRAMSKEKLAEMLPHVNK